MNYLVIIPIVFVFLLTPIAFVDVYAIIVGESVMDINEILSNRLLPIEQKCVGTETKFYDRCDSYCGTNDIISYVVKNSEREILFSGAFETMLIFPQDDFPDGKYIEFYKKTFNSNEFNFCEVNPVDRTVNPVKSEQSFSEMQEQEQLQQEKAEQERIRAETPYTYAEIYAITDQEGLNCDMKYGPPFGSMNQQFAYNQCHNNVNTWELNQLDRTDYYGEPQRESSGGGCLIATATYGSELSPQVQQLRELRDNQLLNTESGTQFMQHFNDVYYSFSPIIADYEREHPVFRETVKLAITPLISSLSILNYVDMDSESEVLGYGISLILLNLGMYLGVPAIVVIGIRKRF